MENKAILGAASASALYRNFYVDGLLNSMKDLDLNNQL